MSENELQRKSTNACRSWHMLVYRTRNTQSYSYCSLNKNSATSLFCLYYYCHSNLLVFCDSLVVRFYLSCGYFFVYDRHVYEENRDIYTTSVSIALTKRNSKNQLFSDQSPSKKMILQLFSL